jgi:hypothetical protein
MGRKLISLVLVVAIAAVAAAVAWPQLIESRVTSEESAAAAALKSGLLPAQVQFQNGGYCDRDGNGIGTYAVVGIADRDGRPLEPYAVMAGAAVVGGRTLNLLAPVFARAGHVVGGYAYQEPISETAPSGKCDYGAERVWAAICYPTDPHCRRFFAINQAGNIYSIPNYSAGSLPHLGPRPGESIVDFGARTPPQELFGASLVGTPQPGDYYFPMHK